MKSLARKLPWLFGSLAIAGLLAYGFWPKPIKVEMVSVTHGSLVVSIDDDGETRIREKYVISAPVNGKLLRLQLHAGDMVEQSKTELVQILPADPSPLDARTQAECEARQRAAEAAKEQADAELATAREGAELALHTYDRALKLIGNNSISQAEFDEAEHHDRIAKANLRSAEFAAKVKLHERELARAALSRVSDTSGSNHQAAMRIVAPVDGRVLRVFHEDSSTVAAGTPLLEVGDPRDLEMEIDVLSSDAVRIQPSAKVLVDHWGGEHLLQGIVRTIEPSAFLKISALGVEEKRVKVIADFTEPWERLQRLGDGYRIEARIVVHTTKNDSLKVAAGCLFRHGDLWQVYRIKGGQAELVSVTVGATNGQETEIVGGLDEGDDVILHPSDQIRAGVSVVPV